jgi:hypothetical protein
VITGRDLKKTNCGDKIPKLIWLSWRWGIAASMYFPIFKPVNMYYFLN